MKLESARDGHMSAARASCVSTWNRAKISAIVVGAKVYITAS